MIASELQENPALEELSAGDDSGKAEDQAKEEGQAPQEPERPLTREMSGVEKVGTLDWHEYMDAHANGIHGSLGAEAANDDEEGPPSWENILTKKTSLEDHLTWQLHLSKMTESEKTIGTFIIGNLNENGYLTVSVEEICQATKASPEEAESTIRQIQNFDPLGVAARDLRECLLIQLENLGLRESLAAKIVSEHLSKLETRRYDKLARELDISVEEVVEATQVITSLEPKPARGFESGDVLTIIPDVFVEKNGDDYMVILHDDGMPRLRVSALYRRLAGRKGEQEVQAREYLQKKVRAAAELIKNIQWRQQTLYRVSKSIFKFQKNFLDHGVIDLKPMVLRDVAEDIGMHESTVSRATTNKYAHTPQGVYELKFFFQSGLRSGDGEDVAAETVKEKIRNIIAKEDPGKPYSDQDIARFLAQETIDIARRTVAKYREAMRILPSSKRRQPFPLK